MHDWYEFRTSPDAARITLHLWVQQARQLDSSSLDSFCDTLLNWQSEIANFFHHHITSGFVGGMNSKIHILKRIAFGIPDFDHFRLRVISFCS